VIFDDSMTLSTSINFSNDFFLGIPDKPSLRSLSWKVLKQALCYNLYLKLQLELVV